MGKSLIHPWSELEQVSLALLIKHYRALLLAYKDVSRMRNTMPGCALVLYILMGSWFWFFVYNHFSLLED